MIFERCASNGEAHEHFIATRKEAVSALDADMETQMRKWGGVRPRTLNSDQQTLARHIAEPWR